MHRNPDIRLACFFSHTTVEARSPRAIIVPRRELRRPLLLIVILRRRVGVVRPAPADVRGGRARPVVVGVGAGGAAAVAAWVVVVVAVARGAEAAARAAVVAAAAAGAAVAGVMV